MEDTSPKLKPIKVAIGKSSNGVALLIFSFFVTYLLASNFQWLIYSAMNSGTDRFGAQVLSLEAAATVPLIWFAVHCLASRERSYLPYNSLPGLVAITAFCFYNIFMLLVNFSPDSIKITTVFISIEFVFLCGVFVGVLFGRIFSVRFFRIAWLFPIGTLAFLLYFLARGRLDFMWGLIRPQISGGIRSTEVSLNLGAQFLYCVFAFGIQRTRLFSALIRASVTVGGVLLLWMASVASLFWALVGVGFYIVTKERQLNFLRYTKSVLVIVALIAFSVFVYYQIASAGLVSDAALVSYTADSYNLRQYLYSDLWKLAIENPLSGIGFGKLDLVPHHNVLGIAATTGLVSSVLYLGHIATMIWLSQRLFRERAQFAPDLRNFAFMALSCYWYFQLKGLTEDTWQLKEMYLWAGIAFGVYSICSERIPDAYRKQESAA